MNLKITVALVGLVSGIGAFLVHDHTVQAVLGIIAVILLFGAYSFTGKKSSGFQEVIRLLLWP